MTGSVDFSKDMNFWYQDKWSGSFPMKLYIIKDVPNNNFGHIILENNKNKAVTKGKDAQEVTLGSRPPAEYFQEGHVLRCEWVNVDTVGCQKTSKTTIQMQKIYISH